MGLLVGSFHLRIEDAADNTRYSQRNDKHKHPLDPTLCGVVAAVQRCTLFGIEIKRVSAHFYVGVGGLVIRSVREHRHDLIFDLCDAVIGKGRDTAAVGDRDIIAGIQRNQEQDTAFTLAVAKVIVAVPILGKLAHVLPADVRHRQQVDVDTVSGTGVLRLLFQFSGRFGFEQLVGVHHQRHFGKRRYGAEQAQHQCRKQRKQFLFHTLFPPFKAGWQAGSSAEH